MDAARAGRAGRRDDSDGHLEAQLQPGGEHDRRRAVARAGDLDAGDGLVRRLVERRGELVPPERQPGPREVGVTGDVWTRRARRSPRSGPSGRASGSVMRRCAIRPSADSDGFDGAASGHQATTGASGRSSPVTRLSSSVAVSPYAREDDDLAGARVAPDADLRVEAAGGLRVPGVLRHDDDAHRVLARRLVRGRDRLFLVPEGGRDDEGQHAAEGDGAAFLADVHQGLLDLRDRGVGQSIFMAPPGPAVAGRAGRRPRPGPTCRTVLLGLALRGPELLDRVEDLPGELDPGAGGNRGGSPRSTSRMSRSYASGDAS